MEVVARFLPYPPCMYEVREGKRQRVACVERQIAVCCLFEAQCFAGSCFGCLVGHAIVAS